jgi:DNA-binding transcriptional ArsR family regulator
MSEEQNRRLSDPKAMRALAHPVRLALLDALHTEGELTASRAGELLGESPGNMSWHLQTLAKYGFVEEAGGGKGRSRPWRAVPRSFSFNSADADPEQAAAGDALESAIIERAYAQFEQWRMRRDRAPSEWGDASFINNSHLMMTPAELDEVSKKLLAVLQPFNARLYEGEVPDDALAVKVFAFGHPLPPTA